MQDLIAIGKEFGFPALMLLLIVVALWRAGKWAGPRIDKLLEAHLQFLRTTSETVEKIDKGVGKLTELAQAHSAAFDAQRAQLDAIAAASVGELRTEISNLRGVMSDGMQQVARIEARVGLPLEGGITGGAGSAAAGGLAGAAH